MTSRGIITSHLREHKNRAHDIASRDRTADFFRLQALSLNSTLSTGNIRRLEKLKTRTYFSLTSQKKSKSYLPSGHQLWYYLLPCCAVFLESFNPSIWNFWKQWVFRSQQAQATCHCFVSLDFLHIKLPWLQFKKDSLSCYANKIGELIVFILPCQSGWFPSCAPCNLPAFSFPFVHLSTFSFCLCDSGTTTCVSSKMANSDTILPWNNIFSSWTGNVMCMCFTYAAFQSSIFSLLGLYGINDTIFSFIFTVQVFTSVGSLTVWVMHLPMTFPEWSAIFLLFSAIV